MVNDMKMKLNKIFEKCKKEKWILLTFIVSLVIVSVIYCLQKIAPFGNNSMLDVDFFHQYGPMLNELYDRVIQGENLIFSFNTGGGIPFYRNFLNYLSSPFNIFLLLFKKENIIMAYSIIIGLKLVFASTFMSIFLEKAFNKKSFLQVIFSILYAFSGYFCAYYWNIMWLDGIVFLPLIILGIKKLIDEDKPILYIISLSIMLFANYFIGYMICIFSVLFFTCYMFIKGKYKIKYILKKVLLFFVSSLLAGGLVAFALIPMFDALTSTSATGGGFPYPEWNFNVIDYIFNHISGVKRTVFASDILPMPNIYCGLISIVMLLILFFNKKVKWQVKVSVLLFLLIFFFSFNNTLVDFMWHAFHVPNDLPYRYSFLYVFGFVLVAYYSFLKSDKVNVLIISISFVFVLFMVMIADKLNYKNLNQDTAIVCSILILIYYLLYILYNNKKINKIGKIAIMSVFIFITCIEVIFGINDNWSINHDIKTFISDKNDYQKLIKYARNEDNDLYRIEKTEYVTLNDGSWYDYYGISTFSSMAYESVSKSQKKLGLAGNVINSYYYRGNQTPVYNTMFNIRYIAGNYINNKYYSLVDSNETAYLNRFNYPTSIAYSSSNDIKDYSTIDYNPFYNQSEFVKKVTNLHKNIFNEIKVKRIENAEILEQDYNNVLNGNYSYSLKNSNKNFKVVLDNAIKDNIYLYVGGNKVEGFKVNEDYYSITSDEYYIIDVGSFEMDEVIVTIELSDNEDTNFDFYAYYIDDDTFKDYYNYINSHKLNITKYTEKNIVGNIDTGEDEVVFTSIAYDEGWSVYVDDKKVDTYSIDNSFLSFDCKKGKHKIELIYYPKGMRIGLIISLISLIMTIILCLKNNKNKKILKKIN